MDLRLIECEGNGRTGTSSGLRVYSCNPACVGEVEVEKGLCTEHLVYLDLSLYGLLRVSGYEISLIVQMLRTDAEDDGLTDISAVLQLGSLGSIKGDGVASEGKGYIITLSLALCVDHVHLRRSDETCNELVAWCIVEILRCIYLLDDTILHNDDSGTQCHRLGLVMCYVDDGGLEGLVELCDLYTHLCSQLRIEVTERLIHEEYLRSTNDRTSHRYTLSLSTGKSLRLSVEEMLEIEDSCSLMHLLIDLCLRNLTKLQTECHVVIYRHMRIQSVVLEYHRDISVLRLNIIYSLAVDDQVTARDILETCNHSKGGRLTTARWSDEDDEFLILDIEVEILNSDEAVRIFLGYIFKLNTCHNLFFSYRAQTFSEQVP